MAGVPYPKDLGDIVQGKVVAGWSEKEIFHNLSKDKKLMKSLEFKFF